MSLLDLRGGYLFQHRPDLMPHGYLCDEEVALWAAYYVEQQKTRKT